MSSLIKDLLSFTVLVKTEGKNFVDVNLNDTVANVIEEFESIIEDKRALINVLDLPVIQAEPIKMAQLFRNLMSNALKFSKDQPVITISSRDVLPNDFLLYRELLPNLRYVAISFNDNGIGFDNRYASQIFKLFERLNDKKSTEGTGTGLSICKKIAEDHGGTIYAHGEEHVGATFTVFLSVG
jgi:signal transduction histidine kinase